MRNVTLLSALEIMTATAISSPAAARMCRHRKRRRDGGRCVTVQIWPEGVNRLVATLRSLLRRAIKQSHA